MQKLFCSVIIGLILFNASYAHGQVVTNPEWDFVSFASQAKDFLYLPRGDEVLRLSLDLYGDGRLTVFLTFKRWGSKSGYNWIAYTPRGRGYDRVEQTTDAKGIVFRTDGFYSFGKIANYSNHGGLYVLYPGKDSGDLLHYDIRNGTASQNLICSIDYSKPKDTSLAALILGHRIEDHQSEEHPAAVVLSAASLKAHGEGMGH